MSWEANIWAVKQRMKLPQEQLVLIVLGNCADPDAVAFSTWPGRDHWWKYLSKITRLSRSSLFRHINTIVALGLASRSTIVLADGSKRPTIALNLEASFDIETEEGRYIDATQSRPRDESHGETHDAEDAEAVENTNDISVLQQENTASQSESHHDTSPAHGTENAAASPTSGTVSVPPVGLHIDSSKSCSKESPPTPQAGGRTPDGGFENFRKAWARPIERLSVAKSEWSRIPTDRHGEAITAARGYWAWLGKQTTKPPPPVSAQTFLRENSGWAQWLPYVPDATGVSAATVDPGIDVKSLQGRAILAMYAIARTAKPFESQGRIKYPNPVTPQMLALGEVEDPRSLWIEDRSNIAAWFKFLRTHVPNMADPVTSRGMGAGLRRGMWVPRPFPPPKDGNWSAELTDQDMADFT